MYQKRIIILFFLLLFRQLVYCQDCDRIDTISLFEVNKLNVELKKGEILSKVIDTIKSSRIYNEFAWHIVENNDSVNQEIHFQLLLDQSYFCYDWCLNERNIFSIELSKYDSIFFEGKFMNNFDSLNKQIIEFITNPKDNPNLPRKRIKYINFLDTVLITNHLFQISAQMIKDSIGIHSSLENLNFILNKVLKNYLFIWNELAKEKWNLTFEKLDYFKKMAILDYYPINIWIFPNRGRISPPPPPPINYHQDYLIDSILKSYKIEINEDLIIYR